MPPCGSKRRPVRVSWSLADAPCMRRLRRPMLWRTQNMADNPERLRAADLITAIKSAGIRFIVALPDRTTSEHLLKPMLADPELRVVQICKEDEGVSICSGLYAAGQRALLLMQHTGLLDSINALRGVAVEGENPVCMM